MSTFTVYGIPAPAGSKRGYQVNGRVVITDDNKRSRPWKTQVATTAAQAMNGHQLLTGPLELHLVFHLPRPRGHYGTGRNASQVRPSAPAWPAVKPDATKLLRAVEDALTGIVYRDDAQIVVQHVEKRYGEPARCQITLTKAPA